MNEQDGQHGISRRTLLKYIAGGAAGLAAGQLLSLAGEPKPSAAHLAVSEGGGLLLERQPTGSEVWQVTTENYAQSNIYCETPYCSRDSRYFVYERRNRKDKTNPTEFVCVEIGTWKQRVLDKAWKMSGSAITPDGVFYYVKRTEARECLLVRARLPAGKPETVHRFRPANWTWSLGTVSCDHRYYVRGKRLDDKWKMFGILLLDLKTGKETIIDEGPYTFNAHPQFEPGDGRQLMIQHNRGGGFDENGKNYRGTGPEGATLFLLSVPGGRRTTLQVGKPFTTRVTGHQAWIGDTREMLLTVSARGDYTLDRGNLLGVRAGQPARVVAKGCKFLHVGTSRCGRFFCCDDTRGDINVVIGSVMAGKTAVVCASKTKMTRAQSSHAHAYLTPDLKWVIFNSTRSGRPHVHAASVPKGMVKGLEKA